jgi:FYVE/RhoGEF/PH domain-containing protein 5/6
VELASTEDRDEWTKAIRDAKSTLLVSLTITRPNSTLTSSASTNHLRRSLQALPFEPSDERLGTIREVYGWKKDDRSKKAKNRLERRAHVDHWVPANWIPDAKADACMRCGRSFGWRRRRHHCRLCGRCVCSSCSARVKPFVFFFGSFFTNSSLPHPPDVLYRRSDGEGW